MGLSSPTPRCQFQMAHNNKLIKCSEKGPANLAVKAGRLCVTSSETLTKMFPAQPCCCSSETGLSAKSGAYVKGARLEREVASHLFNRHDNPVEKEIRHAIF